VSQADTHQNPLGVNSKTVMEAREHFCGYHPRMTEVQSSRGGSGRGGRRWRVSRRRQRSFTLCGQDV